jgi:hypothetical protein
MGRRRRRRCGLCRRGRGLRRRSLWLRLSVGTEFFLGLRDDDRRRLRMRSRACELHHRQSGSSEQHEAKVFHDGWSPRKGSLERRLRKSNLSNRMFRPRDQRPAIRPDCGGQLTRIAFYFIPAMSYSRTCSLRVQERATGEASYGRGWTIGRRIWRGRSQWPARRHLIRRLAWQFFRTCGLAGLAHRRRHFRARTARR